MFTVGLDKLERLIIKIQLNVTKGGEEESGEGRLLKERKIKEIIFGSLLGDGQLEMPPRGLNARFGLIQAGFRKDYVLSVLENLKEICTGKYREYKIYDKRTGKTYKAISFWSRAEHMLNKLYREFYEDKVKRVPLDLSLLTPLALAH